MLILNMVFQLTQIYWDKMEMSTSPYLIKTKVLLATYDLKNLVTLDKNSILQISSKRNAGKN